MIIMSTRIFCSISLQNVAIMVIFIHPSSLKMILHLSPALLEFAFKKKVCSFFKNGRVRLSRINIPGVFSFGYSSTVTQYTALLLQNGLRSILKSHTYSYFSGICLQYSCHPTSKRKLKIMS